VVYNAEKGIVELYMRKTVTILIQELMRDAVIAAPGAGKEPK